LFGKPLKPKDFRSFTSFVLVVLPVKVITSILDHKLEEVAVVPLEVGNLVLVVAGISLVVASCHRLGSQ